MNFSKSFIICYQLGRKYVVGRETITILAPAIKALLLWSTHPYCDQKRLDEKVVQALLMSCVSDEELLLGKLKEPQMMFIEGLNYIITFVDCSNQGFKCALFLNRHLSDSCQRTHKTLRRIENLYGRLVEEKECR